MITEFREPIAPAPQQERLSWLEILRRVLASVVTGLFAALVFQVLGEGTLWAVVIGAAAPQLLEQVAQRVGWWESRRLGPLAVLLGLLYKRDWVRDRLAGADPGVSATMSGGITTVAVAVALGVLAVGDAILDDPPPSLSGTWETTTFTVEAQSGLRSTRPDPRETWTVSPDPGCSGSDCGFRVAVDDGATFTLEPRDDGSFVGSADGLADCVSDAPPHDVKVADGYAGRWTYRVSPRPADEPRPGTLVIAREIVWTANDEARTEDCRSPVSVRYRATAVRAE